MFVIRESEFERQFEMSSDIASHMHVEARKDLLECDYCGYVGDRIDVHTYGTLGPECCKCGGHAYRACLEGPRKTIDEIMKL